MVAKGPESRRVVQIAMDLGALSVRGNHDHELVLQHFKTVLPLKRQFDIEKAKTEKQKAKQKKQTATKQRETAADRIASPLSDKPERPESKQDFVMPQTSRQHACLASEMSDVEIAWMCELPYIVQSGDLGAIFVHAGLEQGVELEDQQPYCSMFMTMQDQAGKQVWSRKAQPWAKHWPGPLTAYFGHDTARGLQTHPFSFGLDTGSTYANSLSAILDHSHHRISLFCDRLRVRRIPVCGAAAGEQDRECAVSQEEKERC